MTITETEILKAFDDENLPIIETAQIEELKRWFLFDFTSCTDYLNDNSTSDINLIIVCGSGRSGTTLTRVMLDSHPAIYAGPESYLFLPKPVVIEDLSKKFSIPTYVLNEIRYANAARTGFIDQFVNRTLSVNNKTIFADKTSRNIHSIGFILKHFPNAKIINVVRDPRACVASLLTHKKRKIENGVVKPTGWLMPLSLCINRWNNAVADTLPFRNNPNYFEVKYEHLVTDTKLTLKALCDFCEVPYHAEMLNYHTIQTNTRNPANFIQNIEATMPISGESLERYKSIFTSEQLMTVIDRTKHFADILNYSLI